MLHLSRRLPNPNPCLRSVILQLRFARTDSGSPGHTRRRSKLSARTMRKVDEKSEWWLVDGEVHEIGDNVPLRERFVIPRDNIPNKRRKQLREQFMRRTRLVIKETEHEPWCKKYIELYQELRENWERLYWDEGYSKKLAQDHANYESAEDDDLDFSPYRRRWNQDKQIKGQELGTNREADSWERVNQIRDKFEYDRDRRRREKAFAPMTSGTAPGSDHSISRNQRFDTQRYFPQSGGIAPGSDDSVSRNQHFYTERQFPQSGGMAPGSDHSVSRNQHFDTQRQFPQSGGMALGSDNSVSRNRHFDTQRHFPQSGGMAPGSDHLVSRNRHFDTQRHFPMSGGTAPLGSDHRHFPHSGRIAPPGSDHSVSRNQRFDNQRYFPQSGEMVPGSDHSVSRNQR